MVVFTLKFLYITLWLLSLYTLGGQSNFKTNKQKSKCSKLVCLKSLGRLPWFLKEYSAFLIGLYCLQGLVPSLITGFLCLSHAGCFSVSQNCNATSVLRVSAHTVPSAWISPQLALLSSMPSSNLSSSIISSDSFHDPLDLVNYFRSNGQ